MDNSPDILAVVSRTHSLSSLVTGFASAAAVVVLLMFGVFLFTGVGQDPLQFVHTTQEYTDILLRNPMVLRFAVGLDNLFIVLYSSMFLALASLLWDKSEAKALLWAAFSLLALSGVLDLMENMHFLTMLAVAVQGIAINMNEIEIQVWESLLKFHVSYLGLFLLGFVMPKESMLEKALSFAFCWVQLPVGLLIYLTPAEIAKPLVLVRFTFFLLALIGLAVVSRRRFG